MRSIELFAGAGGLALGLGRAGIKHAALIERDPDSCRTIRANQRLGNPEVRDWPLYEIDVRNFDFRGVTGNIELVAGGPPCQPFSLGMVPEAARAVHELRAQTGWVF